MGDPRVDVRSFARRSRVRVRFISPCFSADATRRNPALCCRFSHDGQYIASSCGNEIIIVRPLSLPSELVLIRSSSCSLKSLLFASQARSLPLGRSIASLGTRRGTYWLMLVRIWKSGDRAGRSGSGGCRVVTLLIAQRKNLSFALLPPKNSKSSVHCRFTALSPFAISTLPSRSRWTCKAWLVPCG